MLGKILAAIIGGCVVSTLGSALVGIGVGAGEKGAAIAFASFFVFYAYSFLISLRSASSSKAWKWIMIHASILCFLLPISSMFFTGIFIAEQTSGTAEMAGGLLGGAVMTSIIGFFGFFLGIVFLVIGLLVGNKNKPA